MSTEAGVGYSENPTSLEAGIEAASAAMAHAGTARCDLAIVYSTEKHDPIQLRNGLRSIIGFPPASSAAMPWNHNRRSAGV